MFKRLQHRKGEVRHKHDERSFERDRQAEESAALAGSLYNVIESGAGRGRDYWEQLTSYNDRTLALLLDAFGTDPNGLIRILLESVGIDEADTFIRERIRYPITIGATSLGTGKAYRDARECLGTPDMSVLPSDKEDGVRAVLTVCAFWGNRSEGDEGWMEPQLASLLMEMPDRENDIIDYIKERKVALKELNVPHLREALATDIKSLSSGVL